MTLAAELGLEPRPDNPYRHPELSIELGIRALAALMTQRDWAEVLLWYARGADSWQAGNPVAQHWAVTHVNPDLGRR